MNILYITLTFNFIFILILLGFSLLWKNKKVELQQIKHERDSKIEDANELIEKYKDFDEIYNAAEYLKELKNQQEDLKNHIVHTRQNWNDESIRLSEKLETLCKQVGDLEEDTYIQSFGFYKPKYDFENSSMYQIRLKDIRNQQRQMIKDKTAAICHAEWSVAGSRSKGKKMTNNFIKMILRAFNGECDAAVMKVKYNNIEAMEKRIEKSRAALNKLAESSHSEITEQYLNLKMQELYLAHEFQEKKQEEKEEQKAIKERIKEEERAQKELERELAKENKRIEQEEKEKQKALEEALLKSKITHSQLEIEQNKKWIETLQNELEILKKEKERKISQAQLTKAGYVYIISNIGSFGKDVYKIGLTRRLDPRIRVRELGGASVPFPYDIHALAFSEDAPGLEAALHQALSEFKVNRINNRKEFFQVPLKTIEKTLMKHATKEVEFNYEPEAEEYRKTLAAKRELQEQMDSIYTIESEI